jgi:SAM-dependent methyltransferase
VLLPPEGLKRVQSNAVFQETGDAVAYFDEHARAYASWTGSGANFHERMLLFEESIRDCQRSSPTDLCLDLGCGNGELTLLASRLGFRAVGVDGSPKMLHAAAVPDGAAAVTFRCERLPLRDETVETIRASAGLVIVSSVIEYIDDDSHFLDQCAALLATGGHALISFPNAISLWRRYERLLRARGPFRGTIIEVQKRHYRVEDIEALADKAGLTIERISYFGLPYPRILGRILRGRRPRWLSTLMLIRLRRHSA